MKTASAATFHEWSALGTLVRVVTVEPAALDEAVAAVQSEVDAIDAACSRFRGDSELSRVNRAEGCRMPIRPLLFEAIQVALRASRVTGGIVDPTVGEALVRLGYDADFQSLRPSDSTLVRGAGSILRTSPAWQLIELDPAARTVRLPAGVRLDLGATAKALAADRAASAAYEATGLGVLVSLGGDIRVWGDPPPGGWPIRVSDSSRPKRGQPGQTVTIMSGGLATSSTTVRRWTRGGATLHHIVDPATGMPAVERWRTVSVAAASCVDANIAATAAIVLGDKAPGWLSERCLPARLVSVDGKAMAISGWPEEHASSSASTLNGERGGSLVAPLAARTSPAA